MPQVSTPDYYDDGSAPASAKPADRADGAEAGKTAMLNKEVLCGDVAVGAKFTIRIVADHGNEVEVECVSGDKEKPEPEGEPQEQAGDSGMQSMLED
jgi:hypothetical protein